MTRFFTMILAVGLALATGCTRSNQPADRDSNESVGASSGNTGSTGTNGSETGKYGNPPHDATLNSSVSPTTPATGVGNLGTNTGPNGKRNADKQP